MSLGKQYKDDGSKLFILKPTNKDKEKNKVTPHFAVFEKVDGKWVETRQEGRVSGNLFAVEIKEEEYNNIKYKKVSLSLKDENAGAKERYLVDLRFNQPARTLYNMLANLQNGKNVSLSYYEKDGYDRFSLRQNDELVKWKYNNEDLPKAIEVTFKGAIQRDFSPLDDFFEKELRELAKRLGGNADSTSNSVVKENANTPTAPVSTEPVPF